VHDLFARAVYGGHALGRRISGTTETVTSMTRAQIHGYYRQRYAGPSIVVTAAGRLDHELVVELVGRALTGTPLLDGETVPAPLRHAGAVPVRSDALVVPKDTEQAHVVIGCPSFGRQDERRFALAVLNSVLGGGMSSRLFQQVRERRGLAYSIYSYANLFADSGLFAVYAGCAPGKVDEVLELVRAELAEVARHGITGSELARGKGMLAGSLALGLEDTGARMSRLGKGELLHEQVLSVDQLRTRIARITREQVNDVAAQLLSSPTALAAVGPFDPGAFGPWR
jgi:predicted Zn-dependent peptidase